MSGYPFRINSRQNVDFVDEGDAGDVMVNTKGVFNASRDPSLCRQITSAPCSIRVMAIKAAQEKVDELADKDADTVDSDIRYMAYGARLRTALRASTRYVAYVRSNLVFNSHLPNFNMLYLL